MTSDRKRLIRDLLKGIETGDPSTVSVVNESKYIQHNPQTFEGSEGLAALFKRLSRTSPRVNIVRVFEDGDFIFGHTEYDFDQRNIGFEVFRFENGQAVEHWDNIQRRAGPNLSGHTMVDGSVEIADTEKTDSNRTTIQSFIRDILINGSWNRLHTYVDANGYTEHSPNLGDDLDHLQAMFSGLGNGESAVIRYERCHRVLAEGNFVLSMCEGSSGGEPTAFFDLYRLSSGKIVEHWDTVEAIPPQSEWKNSNGKF